MKNSLRPIEFLYIYIYIYRNVPWKSIVYSAECSLISIILEQKENRQYLYLIPPKNPSLVT